jgi:LemA protein
MMPWAIGFAACLVILPLWGVALYNGLVRVRNACDESWSDVDTELKRRYDLIPRLVEVVRAYAAHEAAVLAEVVAARQVAVGSAGSPTHQARDENQLVDRLRCLLATVESYPELKANGPFQRLMAELSETEDRIQAARRFYNANVRDLANRCGTIPTSLVAALGGFAPREYFQIEAVQRSAPRVALDRG